MMTENAKKWHESRYKKSKMAYLALMRYYPFETESLPSEEWAKIDYNEENYQISNYGRVKSLHNKNVKILKPVLHTRGYLMIGLNKSGSSRKFLIHRLVGEAFIPNPENLPELDHIFGNRFDNFVGNLRWCTSSENQRNAYTSGIQKSGSENVKAKLTDEQVVWCRENYRSYDKDFNMSSLAKKFKISARSMWDVIHGNSYQNAEENILNKSKEVDKMSVFENLRAGKSYDVRDEEYLREAHAEFARCGHLCWKINSTDPLETERIIELERELFNGNLPEKTFLTPPFQIDCACRVFLGKNIFVNHGLTVMSVGTVTIEDGVMLGPEVGIFSVNHEPKNIRVIFTKEIRIKKNAWIGARVNILPGVTIGENAIVGTGSIVTKDIPDNAVAVGNPARVVKFI